MNAADTITAAIDKLQRLAEEAFTGPWEAFHTGVEGGDHSYILSDHESILSVSANDGRDEELRAPTADLVVTLHRTIDAQLAILRQTRRAYELFDQPSGSQLLPIDRSGLELARSILGES